MINHLRNIAVHVLVNHFTRHLIETHVVILNHLNFF